MTQQSNFFHFLDGIINVLVVDADKRMCDTFYRPFFAQIPCCRVHYADSIADALCNHLTRGMRFHVCITELGMGDGEHDEFYILEHYARHCSIAVVTADTSAAKGAHSVHLGARAVFDKKPELDRDAFFETFCRMLLINVINHRYDEHSGDSLTNATKVLFEKDPSTVTDWADHMRITDRQLRNLWHIGSGFGAKQMLFLYGCLKNALEYFGCRVVRNKKMLAPQTLYCKKQFPTYFKAHREVLLFILS